MLNLNWNDLICHREKYLWLTCNLIPLLRLKNMKHHFLNMSPWLESLLQVCHAYNTFIINSSYIFSVIVALTTLNLTKHPKFDKLKEFLVILMKENHLVIYRIEKNTIQLLIILWSTTENLKINLIIIIDDAFFFVSW